jgi:hypothetical protein
LPARVSASSLPPVRLNAKGQARASHSGASSACGCGHQSHRFGRRRRFVSDNSAEEAFPPWLSGSTTARALGQSEQRFASPTTRVFRLCTQAQRAGWLTRGPEQASGLLLVSALVRLVRWVRPTSRIELTALVPTRLSASIRARGCRTASWSGCRPLCVCSLRQSKVRSRRQP